MAKSLLQLKGKKRAPRKSKSADYLANLKYFGDEPLLRGPVDDSTLGKALTWYNYMCEPDEAREYILEYLKQNGQTDVLKKFRRVPLSRIPTTYGWIYRMKMRGADVDNSVMQRAGFAILNSLEYVEEEKKEETAAPVADKPSIQERISDKVSDFIGEIENIVDDLPKDWSMYKHLQSTQFPAKLTTKVAEFYRPVVEELEAVLEGADDQLKEGYKKFSKPKLRERIALFQSIIDDCNRYSGNIRKQRAPRKKKAPTADKLLKHFQFQKESNEYKLKSVAPESIIGAQELWTFNTKYKVLTVFRASGHAGLSVKRTAISGFDEENSVSKRIGRNTEESLQRVLTGGKIVLRKLMDEIKSDPAKISDRINNNVVLLKTVR
jgi:hypothetical protein